MLITPSQLALAVFSCVLRRLEFRSGVGISLVPMCMMWPLAVRSVPRTVPLGAVRIDLSGSTAPDPRPPDLEAVETLEGVVMRLFSLALGRVLWRRRWQGSNGVGGASKHGGRRGSDQNQTGCSATHNRRRPTVRNGERADYRRTAPTSGVRARGNGTGVRSK